MVPSHDASRRRARAPNFDQSEDEKLSQTDRYIHTHTINILSGPALRAAPAKRRVSLSLNFAKKALKDDKFKKWFCMEEKSEPNIKTRNSKSKQRLKPVTCRKIRYEKSPLPFLTELLNKEAK